MTDSKKFLTTAKAAEKFAVCPKTIDRWAKDPNLNFPPPVVVNKRKYHDEKFLESWATDRARISQQSTPT
jgi:hypothetical protein